MDLGGGKRADGNAAIAGMVATPEHRAAIEAACAISPGCRA